VIARLAVHIVDFARRRAAAVVAIGLLVTVAGGFYAATHLTVDTNIDHMLPTGLKWRQDEIALDRAFPQNDTMLVIVIDGTSGDIADRAARLLTDRLKAQPELFRYVRQPDGGEFFERNGLLFLSPQDLQEIADKLIAAQPLIGSMARDPSLRGLFDTLALFVKGAGNDGEAIHKLDPTLSAIADAVEGVLAGRDAPVSWQRLMTGRPPDARELRRFVLTRPVLDFESLEPGARSIAEVRRLAAELGIDPQHGARLRLTGPVALNTEQFATLQQGALESTVLSIVLVGSILFAAVRSLKLVGAILATLGAGLVLTAAFAALAIGSLNLVSVAFGVLFIGLADDFSIQFSTSYRDQRHRLGTLPSALRGTAETIFPPLLLAASATAIGFLAFVPTRYTGIRELGLIAGFGMLVALVLNFTLLPALLSLLRPRGEREPIGFRRAAPLDRFLLERRRWVLGASGVLALLCLAVLPWLRFDFDPLNLKDPRTESVTTARDLMNDPMTTPYTGVILTPSIADAEAMATRVLALPEVAQAITAASFIPEEQDKKLPIIADLGLLLGPTLQPDATLPPPTDEEVMRALAACRDAMRSAAAAAGSPGPAERLARALDEAAARGPAILPALRQAVLTGLEQRLTVLRSLLEARPVTLADLPPELRDGWITLDGRARVEVFPGGDARDPDVLARFVAAVRTVAPDVTGTSVTIQEAGRLISGAFLQAGIIAVAAITLLLAAVLRRWRDVLLVIAPLLLAAMLALAIMVAVGMKLNYANIIALPLLLGIGVASNIYFVMNWRAGQSRHLQSSTARGVLFSALTTISAFGSLALSHDPGTSQMGMLLTLSFGCTLFCTLIVLPALLGPAEQVQLEMRPVPQAFDQTVSPSRTSPAGLTRGSVKPGEDWDPNRRKRSE
jgi:hopanoid biosynthesis associated RND transporter like protein HpnN